MKNLLTERNVSVLLPLAEDEEALAACCASYEQPRLYVATSAGNVFCLAAEGAPHVAWHVSLLEGPAALPGPPQIASFSFALELESLCIALTSGELLLLNLESRDVEEVGCIDGGITALEWSPDGEVLAAISGSGNLLVMTRDWEQLAEVPLMPEGTPEEDTPSYADARVVWRGDGKYFATICAKPPSTVAPPPASAPAGTPPCRYSVRVWDRSTCKQHAAGEEAAGLAPIAAWQPNGRHLYAVSHGGRAAIGGNTILSTKGEAEDDEGDAALMAARSAAVGLAGGLTGVSSSIGEGGGASSVLLYERNGLRHGGFDLPGPLGAAVRLAWSTDSELLAILRAPQPGSVASEAGHTLQIWHRSNWHWYLKHQRSYPPSAGSPPLLQWDEQRHGCLHVIAPGPGPGTTAYEQICFFWDTCVSARGTAAVVDGPLALLTPTRHTLVPPPMAAARILFPQPLVDIALGELPPMGQTCHDHALTQEGVDNANDVNGDDCEELDVDEVVAGLSADGKLWVARSVERDLWEETVQDQHEALQQGGSQPTFVSGPTGFPGLQPALLPSHPTLDPSHPDASLVQHLGLAGGRRTRGLCWLTGTPAVLLLASPHPEAGAEEGAGDVLIELRLKWHAGPSACASDAVPAVHVTPLAPVYAGAHVLRIASHGRAGAVVELASGAVLRYTPAGGSGAGALRPVGPAADLGAPCPWVRPTPAEALTSEDVAPLVGLSHSGNLYWGSSLLAAGVTSALCRATGPAGPTLLYTTRKSQLYTLYFSAMHKGAVHQDLTATMQRAPMKGVGELHHAMHAAMRPTAATAAARDIGVRAVEDGSHLIAAPLGGVGVVLQMPRGNLEGISPRSLVVPAIAHALRRRRFARAWMLATRERVDLNVLVDCLWPSFLSSVPAFVADVPNPQDLCELLASLRPGSVVAPGGMYSNMPLLAALGNAPKPQQSGANLGNGAGSVSALALALAGLGTGAGGASAAVEGSATGPLAGLSAAAASAGGAADVDPAKKVDAVCAAVRAAVAALPSSKYLAVTVMSYVKSDPPQLEAALKAIQAAKEEELAAGYNPTPSGPRQAPDRSTPAAVQAAHSPADKALKHLLLHVDVDEAYRTALGMYELALAYMVVNTSAQKDPGEYLSELRRYAAINPMPLQRHYIDISLRRFPSALRNLVEAGPAVHFDRALTLAKEHGLLRQLLALYSPGSGIALPADAPADADKAGGPAPPVADANGSPAAAGSSSDSPASAAGGSELRRRTLIAYADALSASQKFEDAALAYCAAGALEQAQRAYRSAGQWRMVFVVSARMGLGPKEQRALAAKVVEDLTGAAQYGDAARVLLHHLDDVDSGVQMLAQAREWREALRTAYQHARADLVASVVAPAAASAASGMLSDARESQERIAKYLARLREVRSKRLAMAAALGDDDDDGPSAIPDDAASDVMSAVSGLSLYTENTERVGTIASGSSKQASTMGGRKPQKKMQRGSHKPGRIRQGSPHEERSLVEHIMNLAPLPSVLSEASQLMELLVVLGHETDAQLVQAALGSWIAAHQAAKEDVDANPLPPIPGQQPGQEGGAGVGGAAGAKPKTVELAWKWDLLRGQAQ